MVDTDPKSGRVSKFFIGFKAFEPGSKIFACSYSHLVQIIQVTSLSSFFEIFCFWIKWCSPLCPVMKQKRLNKCHFQKYLFDLLILSYIFPRLLSYYSQISIYSAKTPDFLWIADTFLQLVSASPLWMNLLIFVLFQCFSCWRFVLYYVFIMSSDSFSF